MLKKIKSFITLSSKGKDEEEAEYQELNSNGTVSLPSASTKKDLGENDIKLAFEHISSELHEVYNVTDEDPVRMMVVGGVCSVMYLHNRHRTNEIDFYIPDEKYIAAISGTISTLPQHLKNQWPRKWLTAESSGYLAMFGCKDLYENSVRNNVLLFQTPYLKVIVADWRYQLINKIERAYFNSQSENVIDAIEREGKDLNDALAILNLLIKQHKGQPLKWVDIKDWYHGSSLEAREIDYINEEYRAHFEMDAIM